MRERERQRERERYIYIYVARESERERERETNSWRYFAYYTCNDMPDAEACIFRTIFSQVLYSYSPTARTPKTLT